MKLEALLQSSKAASAVVAEIEAFSGRLEAPVKLMEVCGTHTQAISQFGIRRLLPGNVTLVSGPGCPVCVTPPSYIRHAAALADEGYRIFTFGDLLRVPSAGVSLEKKKAEGAAVDVVYSPLDALNAAREDSGRQCVFLAVGFETTIPLVASTVLEAARRRVSNFMILCAHKTVPPPLRVLASDTGLRIDGFLCPGHVSAVIGSEIYDFLPKLHGRGAVVAGFSPIDILLSIRELVKQKAEGVPRNVNLYRRVVTEKGNARARNLIGRVFETVDAEWRGFGSIPGSGLRLKKEFERFDAGTVDIDFERPKEPAGCRCGDVLKGLIPPGKCPLMGKKCTPAEPVGACMVSSEGSCAAYYKYERGPDG